MSQIPPDDDDASRSPSFIPAHPKRGRGVRRLNNRPVLMGTIAFAVVGAAVGWTLHERARAVHPAATSATASAMAARAQPLDGAPTSGIIKAAGDQQGKRTQARAGSGTRSQGNGANVGSSAGTAQAAGETSEPSIAEKARKQAWAAYYQQLADVQRQRLLNAEVAMGKDTRIALRGARRGGATGAAPGQSPESAPDAGSSATPALPMAGGPQPGAGYTPGYGGGFGGAGMAGFGPVTPDQSGAEQKQRFLRESGSRGGTLAVHHPSSRFEVSEGDFIQCSMMTGADSDVPGHFVARVTKTVYDSATGNYPLIPQGSKVIGVYDARVSAGQTRLPMVIQRIIFPDQDWIALGHMPAADAAGFAGLKDQVRTHLLAKFGNAMLLAVAGAGAQLTQPQSAYGQGYSAQQVIAGSLGQQFGELGQQTAQSGLAIPNTIRIRPGDRFTIMVTRDLPIPPYVDSRTTAAPLVSANAAPIMSAP